MDNIGVYYLKTQCSVKRYKLAQKSYFHITSSKSLSSHTAVIALRSYKTIETGFHYYILRLRMQSQNENSLTDFFF